MAAAIDAVARCTQLKNEHFPGWRCQRKSSVACAAWDFGRASGAQKFIQAANPGFHPGLFSRLPPGGWTEVDTRTNQAAQEKLTEMWKRYRRKFDAVRLCIARLGRHYDKRMGVA
jgi:hypothetical protein